MEIRDAYAFTEDIERLSNAAAVMDAMRGVLGQFGIEYFCFNGFPRPCQRFEEVLLASRLPQEWLQLYLDKQYAHADPSFRWCKRTVHPFAWRDAPYNSEHEPQAAEVVQRATDFGLDRGFVVPIPSPAGCTGDVWVGGDRLDLNPRSKAVIHLTALYAFDRIHRFCERPGPPKPFLTAREREVLCWVAQGKSAWEIGEILAIAKRTVDEHVQSAMRKLGAANRTQAVAIGLRERLLDL
jgi:LuxR family quorum sensing-dependent transcriptional regulator